MLWMVRVGVAAAAGCWLVTGGAAAAPMPVPAAQAGVLGFPRYVVDAEVRYERAFNGSHFKALERLLSPDFAVSGPGSGPEGHSESLRDLRKIFDVGQPPGRAWVFRDSVRLDRVSLKGTRARVWLRQELAFSRPEGSATYYFQHEWVETTKGWRLRRLAVVPEQPVVQSLTLY